MKDKIKEIMSYVLIILVVVLIRTFIVTPIRVNGTSMVPTLEDGYFMILKKYDKKFERNDIVVVKTKDDKIIKRIVGLPKEDIEYKDNELYINDEKVGSIEFDGYTSDFKDYCMEDEYFVLGDNREDSIDSRIIGCVNKKDILGKTSFVLFPFNKWGSVK